MYILYTFHFYKYKLLPHVCQSMIVAYGSVLEVRRAVFAGCEPRWEILFLTGLLMRTQSSHQEGHHCADWDVPICMQCLKQTFCCKAILVNYQEVHFMNIMWLY